MEYGKVAIEILGGSHQFLQETGLNQQNIIGFWKDDVGVENHNCYYTIITIIHQSVKRYLGDILIRAPFFAVAII